MRKLLAVVAVGLVATLNGCGTAQIEPDATYESAEELRSAYLKSGVSDEDCRDDIMDGIEDHGWESVNCGMNTILTVYRTEAAMEQSTSKSWNGVDYIPEDSAFITGPNWQIRTQYWNAETVQEVFGGEIERGTGAELD